MSENELRKKYGDATILGIPRKCIAGFLKDGFTSVADADGQERRISAHLKPRLRYEAENDPSFQQVIPYLILRHAPSDRIFCMQRIGGDERLVGQVSLGLGGHMEAGETFYDCLFREVFEEVGLNQNEMENICLCGYVLSNISEVDSVHVGMVYCADTIRSNLFCLERDRLTGMWITPLELLVLRREDKLESWSRFIFDSILWKGGTYVT